MNDGVYTQGEVMQYNKLATELERALSEDVPLLSWHVCDFDDPRRIVVVEKWRLGMFRVCASLTINGRLYEKATPVDRRLVEDREFNVIHWIASNIGRAIGDWIVEYNERQEGG